MGAKELLNQVERRLADVSSSLTRATGGAALCRIDGTGGSAKALEGRMAALLEVRRTLRRDPSTDLTGIAGRWQADLDLHRAKGSSAAWTDYLGAGVDELARLQPPAARAVDPISDDPEPPASSHTPSNAPTEATR